MLISTARIRGAGLRMVAMAVLLAGGSAWGLDPRKAISQYNLDHWAMREGLQQSTVQAVAQTPDGYLWLGTRDGLVRFDGVRFVTFVAENTAELRHNNVSCLAVLKDGSLAVGLSEGGVVLQRGTQRRRVGQEDGLANDSVRSLAVSEDGTLWIGHFGVGVSSWKDGKAQRYGVAEGLPHGTVRALSVRGGSVWVGTDKGPARIENGRVTVPEWSKGLEAVLINAVHEDRAGAVWLGTGGKGLARYESGKLTFFGEKEGLRGEVVRDVMEDRDGNLWVGTGAALNRRRGERFEAFGTKEGLSHDYVRALFEDREGSVWVGLFGGGLNRLKDGQFLNWAKRDGLASDFVYVVREGADGGMWVGTNGGGLSRIRDGQITNYLGLGGAKVVSALGQGRDGTLYAAGDAGLWRWAGAGLERVPVSAEVDRSNVSSIEEGPDGTMWLATKVGVWRRQGGRWSEVELGSGLSREFSVALLRFRRDGSLWMAGVAGVSKWTGSGVEIQRDTAGKGLPKILSLQEDGQGRLWAGSNGQGVYLLMGGKWAQVGAAQGLASTVVYEILDDGKGGLWLTTDRGVLSVRAEEMEQAARSGAALTRQRLYGVADGMLSAECNGGGGGSPAGWRSGDGRLWIPTVKGLAVIDPGALKTNRQAPAVAVEEVVAEDRTYAGSAEMRLGPGVGKLVFHYTGLSLVAPEMNRFRYMLEGEDEVWVEAGGRRSATYTHLKPGRYRFRVQGANNDGLWNTQGASVEVRLEPYFYETWWFQLLLAAGVGAAVVALARLRTNRVRMHARAAALEEANQGLEAHVKERTAALDDANRLLRAEIAVRVQMEEELRVQKEEMETIFDLVPAQIWVKDTKNRYLKVNRQVERDLGIAAERIEGHTAAEVFPGLEEKYAREDEEVIRTGEPLAGIEDRLTGADGKVRLLQSVKVPRRGKDGQVNGIILFALDRTEQERLEERLRQSQRLESLGRLAGGVAHDFNNLLTVINGYSEFLLAQYGKESGERQALEEMSRAGARAALLTQQLLAFSKRQKLRVEVLDLNHALEEMRSLVDRLLGERIELAMELGEGVRCVRADAGQMQQVVMNLVVNARDAMPEGGQARLATRNVELRDGEVEGLAAGRYVELEFSDGGVGMTEETRKHIFEPFYTTKADGLGSGLGLSIVYGIVTQSGGQILVESEAGAGTKFRVLLPGLEERPAVRVAEPREERPAEAGLCTVLVVEDQEAVRRYARDVLESAGARVLEAASGEEALRVWEQEGETVTLVLTDQIMPGMNGSRLAAELRRRRPGLAVVLMSGYEEPVVEAEAARMDGYLRKPFGPQQLLELVQKVRG